MLASNAVEARIHQGIKVKRSLVAVLVLAALIILISPGIVGRVAEKSVEDNVKWADSGNNEIVVTTEMFDRGWFSSEGRHRVELRSGRVREALRELARDAGHRGTPSLLIDTRIHHGIVPLTSLSTGSGSLKPGIARTVSTLQLDPGSGELIELPGMFYSDIGLTGVTTTHYLLEPGSMHEGDSRIEWQGADLTFLANPADRSLSVDGEVLAFSMEDGVKSAEVGGVVIDSSQVLSEYGFSVGDVQLEIGPVSLAGPNTPMTGFDLLSLAASSSVESERLGAQTTVELTGVTVPGFGDVNLVVDAVAAGLHAESLGKIVRAVQQAQASPDPDRAMAGLYPAIEPEIRTLLAAGAELRFDKLDVRLPQGDVTTRITVDLPQSDPDQAFNWPGLLLALEAAADVRLPAALVEMARMMNPQADSLIASGMLKQDGDFYEMLARYESGLLTVNGMPMPVPLPGAR